MALSQDQFLLILNSRFVDGACLISDSSSNVKFFLGYEKTELINQRLDLIVEENLCSAHNYAFDLYLRKFELGRQDFSQIMFPIKKDGSMIPAQITTRVSPTLNRGLEIIGIIT
jgi:hypothetical protein